VSDVDDLLAQGPSFVRLPQSLCTDEPAYHVVHPFGYLDKHHHRTTSHFYRVHSPTNVHAQRLKAKSSQICASRWSSTRPNTVALEQCKKD
jgi:hypothetical protein